VNRRPASHARDLDAAAIVSMLNQHEVRYVVIGAFAAIAQQTRRSDSGHRDVAAD
jgi:hypothetical protein